MAKFWDRRPHLLTLPNIPKPLHGVNPRSVLGSKWWDKERKESYASTNYHCVACGVHKFKAKFRPILESHEVYTTNYLTGRLMYEEAVPLCNACHSYIHDGRLKWLLDSGQISSSRYLAVIQHGDDVLKSAGLKKLTHVEREAAIAEMISRGSVAEWADWRLVINTKPYMTDVLNQKTDKIPTKSVYIGRGSKWGNPYVIGQDGTRERVCNLYEEHVLPTLDIQSLFLKDLACFCAPRQCHGHVIQRKLYCVRLFEPFFKSLEDWLTANKQRS